MKVVYLGGGDIPVPPDRYGGIEGIIYQLSHHVGRLGCQVCVIDIKGGEQQREKRQKSSAKFYEVPNPHLPSRYNLPFLQRLFNFFLMMSRIFLFALSSSLALNKLLGREKIEVIHGYAHLPALAAMIVNKLRRNGAVMVYTTNDHTMIMNPTWRRKLMNFPEIIALKWADHVVAETPAVKRRLVSDFKLDPAKISVIYEGVALDEVEQVLTNKAGACHQSSMVLCTGVVSSRKNQLTAVKAIPQVAAAYPEVKFVFAGPIVEAEYFDLIQRFIAENNLSPWVEFRGEVTRQELYNLYSEAILFLFPTLQEMSQGLVLLDAMAFGLPIIASAIEPIADVVSEEEGTAILFNPHDVDGIATAIVRLLEDSALRQSMSQRTKELVKSFSWEQIATQTLALYNELVQNEGREMLGEER